MSLLTRQRTHLLNRREKEEETQSTTSSGMQTGNGIEKQRPRSPVLHKPSGTIQGSLDRIASLSMMREVEEKGIKILAGYSFCRIAYPKIIINKVADKFSAYVRGAQFSQAVQSGRWDGKRSMVNRRDGSFGIGLLGDILGFLKYDLKITPSLIQVDDLREKPEQSYNFEWKFEHPFRKAQEEALANLRRTELGVLKMVTGGGKCCRADTPVIMYDGTVKMVQDVQAGDQLMGDDSTPRTVLSTITGRGEMYTITPLYGEPYTVNADHILTLKATNGFYGRKDGKGFLQPGKVVDIPLKEYLGSSKHLKHVLKTFHVPVLHFGKESTELPIPPYVLGAWLGDGSRYTFAIYTPDAEIFESIEEYCGQYNIRFRHGTSHSGCPYLKIYHGKGSLAKQWWKYLKDTGLRDAKHIPHIYKTGTWEARLELLAGLLDTDGHYQNQKCFEFVSMWKELTDDLAFVARSLGFRVKVTTCQKTCTNSPSGRKTGTYYRAHISGNLEIIPCRVPRKKASVRLQKKNPLVSGFKVEPVGEDSYYGFELDGNGRFLLGDFTVTHNSVVMGKIIQELGVRTLVAIPSKELLYQTAQNLQNQLGGSDVRIGLLGDGHYPEDYDPIVVAMYPSLASLRGDSKYSRQQFIESMGAFDLLICDECHKICSRDQVTKTWETIMDINAYYRYGISATPYEKEDTIAEMLIRSAFGHLAYNLTMEQAKKAHYVTPFTVVFLKPEYPPEMKRGCTGMSYNDAHDYFIGNNLERNTAVVQAVKRLMQDGRKTLVIAQRINQNELLAKMLAEELGEEAVYLLHGGLERDYRRHSLEDFKKRHDPCVMVASSVGNDGIDIPDISGIVLAHGGSSFFQNVQRTGRGLRVADGKQNLIFVDFDDAELGRWFKNHTSTRAKYYNELGAVTAKTLEEAIKGGRQE